MEDKVKLNLAIGFIKGVRDFELRNAYTKQEYDYIKDSYQNILEKIESN